MRPESPVKPVLVRQLIGESLREERVAQARTLREVSRAAQVSLGYLSEVERGQKEASSELLAAICAALDLPLSTVLNVVSEKMAMHEQISTGERVRSLPTVRAMAQAGRLGRRTYRRRAASSRSGRIKPSAHVGLHGGTLRRSVEAEAPVGSSGSRQSADLADNW